MTVRRRTDLKYMGMHVLFAALGLAGAAHAQTLVTGVPYSATIVHTTTNPLLTTTEKVARASNGSTYTEFLDVRAGHQSLVMIVDVPNHRRISLMRDSKTYTIALSTVPPLLPGQTDDAQVRDRLENYRKRQPQHFATDGQEGDVVPIGFGTVDGRVEYGSKRTFTKLPATSGLRQKVWDTWYDPSLYLEAEKIGYDDQGNPVNVMKVTELQAAEPDPHLFEIPADFVPASAHPMR